MTQTVSTPRRLVNTKQPAVSQQEWQKALTELDPAEVADYVAYLRAVENGEAEMHPADANPYRLTPKKGE